MINANLIDSNITGTVKRATYANASGTGWFSKPENQKVVADTASQLLQSYLNTPNVEGCGQRPADFGFNQDVIKSWEACVKQKADKEAQQLVLQQQGLQLEREKLEVQKSNANKPWLATPTGITVSILGIGALVIGGIYLVKWIKAPKTGATPELTPAPAAAASAAPAAATT